ncbi:MAG: PAS domain-containing protein, partial [Calditrichota bacterium]
MREKRVSFFLLSDKQNRRTQFSAICQGKNLHLLDPEKLSETRLPANAILIVDAGLSSNKQRKSLSKFREKSPNLQTALWTDGNEDKIASIYTNNDFDYLLFDPVTKDRLDVLRAQYHHCMMKRHELELANEKAALKLDYYKDLLDNSTEAVVVLNEDFKINYCNKVLSELFNQDAERLIGKNMQEYLEDGFKVLHHIYQKLTLGK